MGAVAILVAKSVIRVSKPAVGTATIKVGVITAAAYPAIVFHVWNAAQRFYLVVFTSVRGSVARPA